MKIKIDIENWNRKELFHHFKGFLDPSFAIVSNVDVTNAYKFSKTSNFSFFSWYLHKCMVAINEVENLKLRIEGNDIFKYDTINASATISRKDGTFGFSFIQFSTDYSEFHNNFLSEQKRIINSTNLFPPIYSLGCVHCSAIPWINFTSHKEPVSGKENNGIPQLSFGKIVEEGSRIKMPVSINVNHALVDGEHIGEFFDKFQNYLNQKN